MRGSDAVGTLRWGLKKYAWLFLLYVALVAVLGPLIATRAPDSFDAEALVVARRLDMELVALPRYGEAVFDNGEVARAVATRLSDGRDLDEIIPQRVSLVAEQDSIVLRVVGHDTAPDVAANLANTAADAFLDELNSPGEGVGVFTIQSRAVPPSEVLDALPGLGFLIPIGVLAGGSLGLAAVAVLMVVRRPVLAPADAEAATGVPVLASVKLPRQQRDSLPSAGDVVGVMPLCRRLLDSPNDTVVLVSPARTQLARQELSVAAASILERVCDLDFVASEPLRRGQRLLARGPAPEMVSDDPTGMPLGATRDSLLGKRPPMTLIDASEPLDLVLTADSVLTVLIVPHGASLRALRAAVEEHLGAGPSALVLVRRSRRKARFCVRPDEDQPSGDDSQLGDSGELGTSGTEPASPPAVPARR